MEELDQPVRPRPDIDEHAAEMIRPLLDRGEEIIWAGQPDPSAHFSRNDYFLVPLSAIILLVGILWTTTIAAAGVIFIALGGYALIGRFFWKAHRKKLNYYAITGKRLVKLAGKKGKAQPFAEVPGIRLTVGSEGRGTIRFSDRAGFVALYQNSGMEWISLLGAPDEIAFHDIYDARAVHDLVRPLIYRAKGIEPPPEA